MNVQDVEQPQPLVPPVQQQLPQVAQQVPQPPVFALTPGLVTQNFLDYRTTSAQKIFKNACSALPTTFDMKPENLKVFLSEIGLRSITYGWHPVLNISENPGQANAASHSLLTEYGRISVEQVRTNAQVYFGQPVRAAQDDRMLYNCIMESLSKEAKDKVLLLTSEYHIGNQPCGALFLKVVIRESHVDTNATLRHIRAGLSSLDSYMTQVDSDIDKFNQHVRGLIDALHARGARTEDLISNLFKGYAAASDKTFTAYIAKKEDEYDEGQDINADTLMLLAENKYKAMVEGKRWNAPDAQMEKIIALEAQIKKMSNSNKGKKDNKKGNKATERTSNTSKSQKKKGKPAWMTVKPKVGDPNQKVVDKKTYYWCPKHQSWGIHKPQECRGKGKGPANKPKDKQEDKPDGNPTLQLAQALQTIVESDLEEEE